MGNFTLHFEQMLEPQELVRSGRRNDPLRRKLRTALENEYGNVMANPNGVVPRIFDFLVDHTTGNIILDRSSGKRDKIHSICLLPAFVDLLIIASRRRVFVNANPLRSYKNIYRRVPGHCFLVFFFF